MDSANNGQPHGVLGEHNDWRGQQGHQAVQDRVREDRVPHLIAQTNRMVLMGVVKMLIPLDEYERSLTTATYPPVAQKRLVQSLVDADGEDLVIVVQVPRLQLGQVHSTVCLSHLAR